MNECKHDPYGYFNPKQNQKQESVDELIALITMFMTRNTLKPEDFTVLSKVIKQLNAQQDKLPSKVLRAMKNRFEKIKQQYQSKTI